MRRVMTLQEAERSLLRRGLVVLLMLVPSMVPRFSFLGPGFVGRGSRSIRRRDGSGRSLPPGTQAKQQGCRNC